MAKAGYWTIPDAETRKCGEQTGLDTLVKDFWPLYQEQEKLMVNYYFYGTIDAPLNFIEKVDRYEGLFEFALKRLDLIENQVRLRAKNINYLDGALICRLKKDADSV